MIAGGVVFSGCEKKFLSGPTEKERKEIHRGIYPGKRGGKVAMVYCVK